MALPSIQEIDQARAAAELTRKALYEAAGIHHSTYGRNITGKTQPNTKTLEALQAALDRLTGNGV